MINGPWGGPPGPPGPPKKTKPRADGTLPRNAIKIPRFPNLYFPLTVRVYGHRALTEFNSYVAAYRRVQKAFRHSPNFRKPPTYLESQGAGPLDLIAKLKALDSELDRDRDREQHHSRKGAGASGVPVHRPTLPGKLPSLQSKLEFKRAHVFLPLLYFEITAPKHTLSLEGGGGESG